MLDSDANNMLNKTMYMHEDSSYSYSFSDLFNDLFIDYLCIDIIIQLAR